MASFADSISQFNPYIQQLPVEAMTQVGMYKQQKYDEGVQKIQSYIDNVAGMDVVRDIDKAYLQSKLNELGSKLKTVAAGDFSNYQLVNSVGGMATQIAKDPNVQNAVMSASKYRKEIQRMQKDIDEGKSSPDNILHFQKRANQWISSTNLDDSFNASYKSFFDIFKFAKETFDVVQPDNFKFDQIFQLGPDGKPIVDKKTGSLIYSTTMTRLEREGRFPKKVMETLDQIFSDPRVAQQLDITGEYNYRGYDETALVSKLENQKTETKAALEEKLLDYEERKTRGEDVQTDIDAISDRLKNIDSRYDNYINLARENPDQVRSTLHREDVYNRYVTMFGKISSSQLALENPSWKAQFDMQKEANAQSRWAQTEERERKEFAAEQEFKNKQLKQNWDIAVLNASTRGKKTASGLGVPDDASRFEQGNQFSDIDVIQLEDTDYKNAASEFTTNSADFIWDASGFSEIPVNRSRVEQLMNSGKTAQEAKYTILSELAAKRKIPLEEFMANYVNKSTIFYQNLTPEQRAKNPSLVDAYNRFYKTERVFKNQQATRKNIEDQQARNFGSTSVEGNKALSSALANVKDQKVKIGGAEYIVTKDDVYDLGLWLKGNLSALGTVGGVDEHMRASANEAEKRLKARGKENLIGYIRENNLMRRAYRGGPITLATDVIRSGFGVIPTVKDLTVGASDYYGTLADDVDRVFKVVDQESFVNSYKGRAETIRKAYGIQPNLKTAVFTGDSETDNNLLYNLKRWTGEYTTSRGKRMNVSEDFSDFAKTLGDVKDPKELNLSAQPKVSPDGNVAVEIISYDSDGKRSGGMTIQPDEASRIGIDVETLYESREIASLRNLINYGKGKTSAGNPKLKETYIQGDSYYKENDFGALAGSGYRAQGNIIYKNGNYYPIVYITDNNGRQEVRELTGSPRLSLATGALLGINPMFAEAVLNKY